MKNIFRKTLAVVLCAGMFTGCSLDEWNPSTVDVETAYAERPGFESLINYCYDGYYYLYGKIDGIGAMELGTDLWISESFESGFTQYNSNMNTQLGTLKTLWEGFYSTINYANTAIYYASSVTGYASQDELYAKLAEAYFFRGWANWHLVEQFGGVVLNTTSSAVTGINNSPVRSSESDFYDLIISDLNFAKDHLPYSQGDDRGRVSKKAALAMLAKVYLQRTRLKEANAEEYARLALQTAEELINNASKYNCALYTSDADKSGYAKLWDGDNNKNNTEFLFIEAIDHEGDKNPEGNNRGRTRQYYEMRLQNYTAWGLAEKNCAWYGRSNSIGIKPTKYLLTTVFEPVRDPADTRFANTFFTEYYNSSWADKKISQSMIDQFGKDASLLQHVIKNTAGTYKPGEVYYGGRTVFYQNNSSGNCNMVDENGDGWLDGISVLTPNYTMSAAEKAMLPFVCVDPSDMFTADGKWVTETTDPVLGSIYKNTYPSMNKFSSIKWIKDNQKWEGDVPVIRLGEIYLVAAEAALRASNDQAKALKYVQPLRDRAAVTGRQAEMKVNQVDMTIDFILQERARELAGEQVRWYDLKRCGKLTKSFFAATNPDILFFDEAKHIVRPIPQSFLDAIANPNEFGTNGY